MATRRRLYVDSSAYLAVLLGEEDSAGVASELASGADFVSSTLLVLEVRRALVHRSRAKKLPAADYQRATERLQEDLRHFRLKDLSLDLCQDARIPDVSTPRSLDLAHLATAMWFHGQEPLTRFLSLDRDQLQAARELGLPI